jgi:transaldolase
MKIFLDTADIDQISKAYETGMIDGVTTNPTLILKSGRQLIDVANEIATKFDTFESISCEVVGDTAEEMLSQAKQFYPISPNITIKVPCTVEGLKACKFLSEKGIKTNVTLVFSAPQAVLAAKSGATYISPFVGRLDDNSFSGLDLVSGIADLYRVQGYPTMVLAASIRNAHQVSSAFGVGAHVATIPPNVFWAMYQHVLTEKGLDIFQKDWETVTSNLNSN